MYIRIVKDLPRCVEKRQSRWEKVPKDMLTLISGNKAVPSTAPIQNLVLEH